MNFDDSKSASDPVSDEALGSTAPVDRVSQTNSDSLDSRSDQTRMSPLTHSTGLFADRLSRGQVIKGRYEVQASLGLGGFGAVYRAHDRDLNRSVAIKQSNGLRSFVAGQIRNEAKLVASLNHPNIVAIHDLIKISDDELLIVMECLEGTTLRHRLGQGRLTISEAIEIAIQTADALQHAHAKKLVHSDLKPSNLFLCSSGLVKLLDFGLAVAYFPYQRGDDPKRESEHIAGTPGYMSPEQIRGESHRIDGRTDVFAFGVVLYEMLTGTRPFSANHGKGVHEATLRKDPPPPRQLNPEIDDELQRIVMRCLEKRISDRYDSMVALRADLDAWWQQQSDSPNLRTRAGHAGRSPLAEPSIPSVGLLRRGLQSFTESDAAAYLPLVPGPRDRHGVPLSIAFWKHWAESDDPMTDHPVAVLYGPSGAGKTSYVRAGLLSHLNVDICKVYIECRPGNLGERLTRIIQHRIHDDLTDSSLRDLLNRLRSDESHSHGFRKLLIVLDQFESWAQSATQQERQEFAEALRQCDGEQIRALVVTRDDYWMGVKELLRWLEIPIQEGRNLAAVDLLSLADARRILESMGREAEALPPWGQELSTAQTQFLEQAVDELAVSSSIICVHLVMFAQMMRLQRWTPRALRASGGVVGACSLFLQELFSASSHSPQYRHIAPAVAPILEKLIPPSDEPVASVNVTIDEIEMALREAGCVHLLNDAITVLRDDLRLISLVAEDRDVESDEDAASVPMITHDGYRLAHDFLVLPINNWLDRVRQRTWRGRCKARLSELSQTWSRRPDKAYLPGFVEFLSLAAGSLWQRTSEPESRFLRAAARLHAGRISVAVIALVAFIMMTATAAYQRTQAQQARQNELAKNVALLLDGPAQDVGQRIEELKPFGADAIARVRPFTSAEDPQLRFRSKLFVLSRTPTSFRSLSEDLPHAASELFTATLHVARQSDDAVRVLEEIAREQTSPATAARAAILLAYLGKPGTMESLLAGSRDADRDQKILLQAAQWRGEPAPWLRWFRTHSDPQVRYHAGVILGTYKRDVFEHAGIEFDFASLINSPEPEIHSVSRFLAYHMGRSPQQFALNPPDRARWRRGPGEITMARIPAGSVTINVTQNFDTNQRTLTLPNDVWFATTAVSRRLYNQFASDVRTLPDGTPIELVTQGVVGPPDEQRSDDAQPVMKLGINRVYAFCNWLSEQEGLDPCFTYQPAPPQPPSIDLVLNPPIDWLVDLDANGYRVPTNQEYRYAIFNEYRSGVPWAIVRTLGHIGGDYEPAKSEDYVRPLFSLIPNRWGLFIQDTHCGAWLCGHKTFTTQRLGKTDFAITRSRDRTVFQYGIYLVRNTTTAESESLGPPR